MSDLGVIGTNLRSVATGGYLAGAPWWWDPANRAIGVKNQDSKGSVAGVGGYLNGRVPADFVTIIVADFGQSGGGVAIFG